MPPNQKRRTAVLGAGAWGTALANLAARSGGREEAEVTLWARDPAHVAEMTATGVNARYLPGVPLHSAIHPTADPADIKGADLILAVVPAQALRQVLEMFAPHVAGGVPIIIFAKEVAKGLPTAVTLAAHDGKLAAALAAMLAAPFFRLYSSSDVRGVEIGGAAKNVLAIASGIAAGRGLGASAGAALIARGFAELARFGRAYGADPATLSGLSGLGDLVLTCTSHQSRNFSFGFALGQGLTLAEAATRSGLCEGAHTCGVLVDLAHAKEIEMPIAEAVDAVLAERITVDEAIGDLLARPFKPEFEGDY